MKIMQLGASKNYEFESWRVHRHQCGLLCQLGSVVSVVNPPCVHVIPQNTAPHAFFPPQHAFFKC